MVINFKAYRNNNS